MKIVFCSDCHLGASFDFKRTKFGFSQRSLDFLDNMKIIADHAIEIDASIVAITGDLYDDTIISANVKRFFRKNFLFPLIAKKIKVIVIGGNHDSNKNLNFGCDIEDLTRENVVVKRNPGAKKFKIDGESVGFVMLPYVYPSALAEIVTDKQFDTIPSPQVAAEIVTEMMPNFLSEIDGVDRKIVLGHYQVAGTRMNNTSKTVLKDMVFNRAMLHEQNIDLAVFGHVHCHQQLGDKVVVPGSIERIDFGERGDSKVFIDYDTATNKWNPISLDCRKMTQVDLIVSGNDPTSQILSALKDADVNDAMVKLVLRGKRPVKKMIDPSKIALATKDAFHVEREEKWDDEVNENMVKMPKRLDPISMTELFIEMKCKNMDDAIRAKILEKTIAFMGEKR
jgi:exonuclease SbcD